MRSATKATDSRFTSRCLVTSKLSFTSRITPRDRREHERRGQHLHSVESRMWEARSARRPARVDSARRCSRSSTGSWVLPNPGVRLCETQFLRSLSTVFAITLTYLPDSHFQGRFEGYARCP